MNQSSGANPLAGAANAFTNIANAAGNAVVNTGNAIANAANAAVTNTGNAINNAAKAVNGAVNQAVNQAAPVINSILPFGTPNANRGAANAVAAPAAPAANTNMLANAVANANKSLNAVLNGRNGNAANAGFAHWPLVIFIVLVTVFVALFAVFNEQIRQAYEALAASFKQALGLSSQPPVQAQVVPTDGSVVTMPPEAPQTVVPDEAARRETLVEKILPTGAGKEVFNVAQNKFTYYDAEPLCRALGAELATYEQVKDAWGRGADWCNYGWVKGQMAVYPTQEETYEKLQTGTPEERQACGTVGINGGFFDNPELRYGVNCYGKKPPQSAHDETKLMEQGKVPRSPAALTVDRLAAEFREQKDSLFVRPFNDAKWYA
jgi:hypothetical protein